MSFILRATLRKMDRDFARKNAQIGTRHPSGNRAYRRQVLGMVKRVTRVSRPGAGARHEHQHLIAASNARLRPELDEIRDLP